MGINKYDKNYFRHFVWLFYILITIQNISLVYENIDNGGRAASGGVRTRPTHEEVARGHHDGSMPYIKALPKKVLDRISYHVYRQTIHEKKTEETATDCAHGPVEFVSSPGSMN